MSGECNDCDKECKDHGANTLLVGQHSERISDCETSMVEIGNDVSKVEGRINTFTWVVGLLMAALCTIAFYGLIQLSNFKDSYMRTMIEIHKTLSTIQADVTKLKEDEEDR